LPVNAELYCPHDICGKMLLSEAIVVPEEIESANIALVLLISILKKLKPYKKGLKALTL
jgi:hypothetical protein